MTKFKYLLRFVSGFLHSIVADIHKNLYRLDDLAAETFPKSWLFHFISFFLLSCAVLLARISPWFIVGAALAQEYEQFLHYFAYRNCHDFVMDLLADAAGLLLAIKLMQNLL
ncbi:MAG: hypothetical protein U5R06_02375 [candidate division KSB1 bacterium]|nr:hypothetical protein [candidate division KSB1 bacterium]